MDSDDLDLEDWDDTSNIAAVFCAGAATVATIAGFFCDAIVDVAADGVADD